MEIIILHSEDEKTMEKVIFLDRDGTLNVEVNYLYRPEDLQLLPGVPEALRRLKEAGYKLVVVTNQAGVARGYYREADVDTLHRYMNEILAADGAEIDAFFYCPHHPEHGIGAYKKNCLCRKPGTGMFEQAEALFDVDRKSSWMIGDKLIDTEAGRNYGVRTVLVGTGYGRAEAEKIQAQREKPFDFYAEDLETAVRLILEDADMMTELTEKQQEIFDELFLRYPCLEAVRGQLLDAYRMMEECYAGGGKLLVGGNGGSCADAEHIVGELMKGFIKSRRLPEELRRRMEEIGGEQGRKLAEGLQGSLPAIALTGHPGLSTAFLNDVDGEMILAQQLCGYGVPGDVFLGISTSGNSSNVDYAVTVAKAKGLKVIGLTGKDGGRLGQRADVAVIVPERETFKIQELHLPIYHVLCLMLEERFF